MSHLNPIAYAYDADYHCEACTRKAFPDSGRWPGITDDDEYLEDSEGNEIYAVSPWDEWYDVGEDADKVQTLNCGDCGAELARVEL